MDCPEIPSQIPACSLARTGIFARTRLSGAPSLAVFGGVVFQGEAKAGKSWRQVAAMGVYRRNGQIRKAWNCFRAWAVATGAMPTKEWNYGKLCVAGRILQTGLVPTLFGV